jgi:hypothetical protein
MDDIVRQAMAKWPNVPACFGWLGLDARGNWWMRDDRTQALGSFQSGGQARGSKLAHEKLIDFIGRNYACETLGPLAGCWYFQNGPQRVYVELEAAPWVWRLSPVQAGTAPLVSTHTRQAVVFERCLTDTHGRVWLQTDGGLGLVHSQDVDVAASAIEAGLWSVQELPVDLGALGFVGSPQALRG